jgi:hypothetical protein
VRELGTGKSRLEIAESMGLRFKEVPTIPVLDGIGVVRGMMPRMWFDKVKTKQGTNALKQYRKEYNEKYQRFSDRPLHDWSSNGADAFRYLCVSYQEQNVKRVSNFVAQTGMRY